MALYFLNMKTFGRAAGSSAASAIAYRAGERIRDERTGKVYDHSSRRDVMHKEIVLPTKLADADMSWAKDRANLWNAAEAAEPRKNARVAREFLVALPFELTPSQRLELVRGFAQNLADRYQFAVDFAIHAPRTDPRNFHAHLLATTREVNMEGFGRKTTLELSDATRRDHGLAPFFEELTATRERWATAANEALHEARVEARIDHRSLEAQGIDREPTPHIPRAIYEVERRGELSEAGERIREEYRRRVQARLQRAASHSARIEPARVEPVLNERAQTGDLPRPAAKAASAIEPAGPARRQTLEEIRREARENWLQQRQQAAARPANARERSMDDDLTR
jgi:ATP-dependent exoDNAse (exonuclease V) alpha subunit